MNNDIYVEKNGIKLVKIMEDIREEKLAPNTISGGQYARLKWTINKIKNSKLGETKITRYRGRSNLEIKKNKMENKVDSILSGIIAISNMVSNPQVNNRPKKKIRRYRTLSKQAMKEYAMKQANSSGFDWFDEEEEM